jgi:GntR family transcriptional regulator, transcriptional repressor for pyruvate dehydrogenase complex
MVKLRRISTPEAVVNYFRDEIRSGALKPGEPLPSERVLIGRMGISRLSLREGLARLKALGIIRTRHGKGASVAVAVNSESLSDALLPIVSDPSSRTFRDLLDARIVIEAEVGARAARNRTGADVEVLAAILHECEVYLDDPARFGRLDLQFHRETARIANNAVLAEIHSMVLRSVEQFILENVGAAETRRKAHEDHLRIRDGIRDGMEEQVRADVAAHIGTCVAHYEELFATRPGTASGDQQAAPGID